MFFFDEDGCNYEWKDVSTADPAKETRFEQIDRIIFAKPRTAEWARQFLRVHIPEFLQKDDVWLELEPIFEKLDKAMGGRNGTLTVT